ncbi:MAG: glycoside hydrolase family 15 protein [Anaerolineae bacterium]|nr:glycoside hydrolase family 15 protein [Anaerolineae bacterium]
MTNLHQVSIEIIRQGQADSGGYVASPTFSQYGFSWLRDGTWTAYAMQLVGEHASAAAFYRWAGATLMRYEAEVEALLKKLAAGEALVETDFLPTRFHLDGRMGLDDWPNFQLDGYGTWLWGLVKAVEGGVIDAAGWQALRPAAALTVRYVGALWQFPNYDCWEEHRDHIHPATLSALYGGLMALRSLDPSLVDAVLPAAIRAFVMQQCVAEQGHFMKFVGNSEVDASLLWTAVPYGLVTVTDPVFQATLAKIERDLHVPAGGVYRYAADTYFGGGEWLLLAAWLGWAYVELGRHAEAEQIYHWIENQALPNGEMPEQVATHVLDASYLPYWEARWGTSACPLLWSHAMYLILGSRLQEVRS